MWIHNSVRSHYITTILALWTLAAIIPASSTANEMLRIAGMGGTRIATSAEDAGIFGNPASLVSVKHHNLALGITTENLHWTELPKQNRDQFVAETNVDLYPSVYYSHAFGEWGISAGYTATLTNFANFTVSATRAEYDINTRRFSAETDLVTDYSLFREERWVLALSREVAESVVGTRLKWVGQGVKTGAVVSTLNLAARHGPDVDAHAPQELIEAITEELQFGDRVRDIVHERQLTFERTTNRLELDIGLQRKVWFNRDRAAPPLQVGVLFENVLRANLVEPLPFRLGIGVAYEPLEWIRVAADLSHAIGQHGINSGVGIEFQKTWKSGYAIAFRIGLQHIEPPPHFTTGIALVLGTLSTEYTLVRPLTRLPISEARHLLALTLRL